jgi:hypothetical protein
MSGYDALHRQCRTLESLFDAKLTAYARLASSIGRGGDDAEASGSRARWSEVEEEVDDLLEKVRHAYNQRNGGTQSTIVKGNEYITVCAGSRLCESSLAEHGQGYPQTWRGTTGL